MKLLIISATLVLVGCASSSPPAPEHAVSATANCAAAKKQIPLLEQKIILYRDAHSKLAPTDDDRKYIARIKNVIWSLRSTCPSEYL